MGACFVLFALPVRWNPGGPRANQVAVAHLRAACLQGVARGYIGLRVAARFYVFSLRATRRGISSCETAYPRERPSSCMNRRRTLIDSQITTDWRGRRPSRPSWTHHPTPKREALQRWDGPAPLYCSRVPIAHFGGHEQCGV